MLSTAAQAMRTGMASLLESAKYSDLTLTCHGREFKEANTRTLSVENFDQATVQRMLSYLYTFDYDSGYIDSDAESSKELVKDREDKHTFTTIEKEVFGLVIDTEESSDIETAHADSNTITIHHILVYAIADYYDIPDLVELAVQNIHHQMYSEFQVEGFVKVVKKIYASTPDGEEKLRGLVHVVTAEQISELIQDDGFMDTISACPDLGAFTANVLRHTAELLQEVRKSKRLTEASFAQVVAGIEETEKKSFSLRLQWVSNADHKVMFLM
ncbi:hypothetical protein B0A49_08989 [Cryomyces minteri]|uniref:BTB domain-containing protein n=1 Tax=Cryomyces minteri TaxID=331657 RepID=A0A4V5NDF9_9PEZI|nr:hypothetical protein B0A49_08989 [Cryomyces minteri]